MGTSDRPDSDGPDEEGEDFDEASALLEDFADAVNNEDVKEQEAATLKFWQHLAENDVEPSPWLQAMGEAHQREAAFDWVGTEEAYKRAIQVAVDEPMLQYQAYRQLRGLYGLVNLDTLALEAAQAATQAARHAGISSLLSLALQAEAGFSLRNKDFQRTRTLISEALAVITDGPMHNLERAYALVLRADCSAHEGDFCAAEEDLDIAWNLLEPHTETFFAGGWQYGLASWWATKARFLVQQNDLPAAIAAWHESVARGRITAQLPQLEGPYKHNSLAVALRDLGRALREAGDELAADAFKESHSIRRAIGLPPLDE